jgi:hypothetical protein
MQSGEGAQDESCGDYHHANALPDILIEFYLLERLGV